MDLYASVDLILSSVVRFFISEVDVGSVSGFWIKIGKLGIKFFFLFLFFELESFLFFLILFLVLATQNNVALVVILVNWIK
jgi:hypothetical protein